MPFVVIVAGQKGGVGKTTLSTNLFATAGCGSEAGTYDVGILDADRQGNTSSWAVGGHRFQAVAPSDGVAAFATSTGAVAKLADAGQPTPEAARQHMLRVPRTGGFLVPATPYWNVGGIHGIRVDLVPVDVLVVDTPPSLPDSVFRSLVAKADVVLCPVQPEPWVLQNVPNLIAEMNYAGRGDMLENGAFRLVLNDVQKTAGHRAWETVLRAHYGRWLSDVVWPRSPTFQATSEEGTKYSLKAKPAQLATALWGEIWNTAQRRAAA
jgi:cellulose biosynthesis protein BcsQ